VNANGFPCCPLSPPEVCSASAAGKSEKTPQESKPGLYGLGKNTAKKWPQHSTNSEKTVYNNRNNPCHAIVLTRAMQSYLPVQINSVGLRNIILSTQNIAQCPKSVSLVDFAGILRRFRGGFCADFAGIFLTNYNLPFNSKTLVQAFLRMPWNRDTFSLRAPSSGRPGTPQVFATSIHALLDVILSELTRKLEPG